MTAAAIAQTIGGSPIVSEADAADDRSWFLSHPQRRYRARRNDAGNVWIVRHRPGLTLLRTCCGGAEQLPPDNDTALRVAWVTSAWPWLASPEWAKLINKIKKREGRQ